MSGPWFTSDTHFGHTNIIKYSKRPFQDVEEMNEHMIAEWNKRVQPNDDIFHLGDFAFMKPGPMQSLLYRLQGKKHIIFGNHDQWLIENGGMLVGNGTLESVQHYREIKYGGKKIVLFHYGQRVWNKSHHGSIHLYGHSHGSLPPHGLSVDVGVDSKEITAEYRPIHLTEILDYMSKREKAVVDHHGEDD